MAILLHEGLGNAGGKTGISLLRYGEIPIVVVIDQAQAGKSLVELTGIPRDLPIVDSVQASLAYNPDVLAIGIAPSGGALPDPWWQEVKQGVVAGLSVVNGLHTPMATDPELRSHLKPNQWIWDVRQEPDGLTVGSGQARKLACRRVLTVGTDMGVGKMSTSIELHRAALARGWRSHFVATGQTGLMLGHAGVPLDAVRVDFAAGAIQQQVIQGGESADIVFVEGQGSLMNPASTATLPLIRGTQPTHLILVHRYGQTHISHFPEFKIPPLSEVISVYQAIATAGGTFQPAPIVGIALNTGHLSEAEAQDAIAQVERETGLPCTDAIRFGAEPLMEAIATHDASSV